MKLKSLEAVTTPTSDLGQFTAIAAAYTVDRERDRIIPGAFENTIAAWHASGRRIPLAWDHGRGASDVIGSIDPQTMRETPEGLYVEGQLDLEDSETAREAWRSVKNNSIGLSFGYLAVEERPGGGRVTELGELDLLEVSLTSVPMNASARILTAKAAVPGPADIAAHKVPSKSDIELAAKIARTARRLGPDVAYGLLGLPRPEQVLAAGAKSIGTLGHETRLLKVMSFPVGHSTDS